MKKLLAYIEEYRDEYFLVIPPQEGDGWEIDERDPLTGMTPLRERTSVFKQAADRGFHVALEEMEIG